MCERLAVRRRSRFEVSGRVGHGTLAAPEEGRGRGKVGRTRAVIVAVVVIAAGLGAAVARPPARVQAATTSSIAASADASVDSSRPTASDGTASVLRVDGTPEKQAFLRFSLATVTGVVTGARLRIHVDDALNAESDAGGILATTSNVTWTEAVTWNTRPAIDGPVLATIGPVARNAWVELDVTDVVRAGSTVSFALTSPSDDGVSYDARNAGADAPKLIIDVERVTTTVPAIADTTVEQAAATANHGASSLLQVDGKPVFETLMRFDLRSFTTPIREARLRMHALDISNGGSDRGGTVARIADNTWDEATVTWATKPARGSDVSSFGAVDPNEWAELDVTAAIKSGALVSFSLRSVSPDGAYFDSREVTGLGPELVVTTGPQDPVVTGQVVAAVGDAVCVPTGTVSATTCRHQAISDLVVNDAAVTAFLGLGDLQYDKGELANFRAAYEPSYGRAKAITKPVPGNHEYLTPGAAGYYEYFGPLAGDPSKGYYSFDVGADWHVVALNTTCVVVACTAGSEQELWLRADLAASSRPCTLAFGHQPRFSSGRHGEDLAVLLLWEALQQHGADVVLSGHDHHYERFGPLLPDGTSSATGMRSFIVGTGGRNLTGWVLPAPHSLARHKAFGVLKLTLGTGAYSWRFVNEAGKALDSGMATCR